MAAATATATARGSAQINISIDERFGAAAIRRDLPLPPGTSNRFRVTVEARCEAQTSCFKGQ
jgi:hypothetical protein